jgi:hypothetical protein
MLLPLMLLALTAGPAITNAEALREKAFESDDADDV